MKFTNVSFKEFIEIAENAVCESINSEQLRTHLTESSLCFGQAFYEVDWSKKCLIGSCGFEELLDRNSHELTFLDIIHNLIHPEDRKKVQTIIQELWINTLTPNYLDKKTLLNAILKISYRIRKKNGSYIKVLRSTKFSKVNEKNIPISNFSLLTDITKFDTSKEVKWETKFFTPHEESGTISKLHKMLKPELTIRECEVMELLKTGTSTKEIAQKLFISEETVKSHKKSLFQKFSCRNSIELINKVYF